MKQFPEQNAKVSASRYTGGQGQVPGAQADGTLRLIYVSDGIMNLNSGERSLHVGKDMLIFLDPRSTYSFYPAQGAQGIGCSIPLQFAPEMVGLLMTKPCGVPICLPDPQHELHALLMLLCTYGDTPATALAESLVTSLLSLAELKMQAMQTVSTSNFKPILTERLWAYLHFNYRYPITMDSLAKHFGYSRSRLSHIFSQQFGCSLPRLLNSLRCGYARSLLRQNELPLLELAMRSGFQSIRTFHRAYKEIYGLTPRRNAAGSQRKEMTA